MEYIYVISASGKPLMPTTRRGHVKRLMNKGKARIKSHVPFVIQLKYETPDNVQPLHGGIDPGRTNIGAAAVRENGTVVYRAHISARNKEVPRLMAKRKAHRQASRRGERLARKRLAKKLSTTLKQLLKRKLPGYKDGFVTVKDIINTESKSNNRKRPKGWLTPTARQLVQTHMSMVKKICSILPVPYWSLELNRFSFMRLDDGTCCGIDFQNGRLKGYPSVEAYVSVRQHGQCYCCGKPIEQYHHMVPRNQNGSSLPENIIGLCHECHEKIHTGQLTLDIAGIHKKYGALSVVNQAVPYIWKQLTTMFGSKNVGLCSGYQTKRFREQYHLNKDHDIDAVAIAMAGGALTPCASNFQDLPEKFELLQFRRHDRQMINNQRERTYRLNGVIVARNRHKRFEQKNDSLEEFRNIHPDDICRLEVTKSTRRYNNPGRLMPGAVFLYQGVRYVMTGQLSGGSYYRAAGQGTRNFHAVQCLVIRHNTGLVYV